ncbi:hypothetical protein [Hymenobacter psychrotolerans]|uniref:Uncharacterized protein n=1 Tax=Hymenobacter psychrotolerans DSM 18569 TaxID=1121959 RepID=A0A1M6Z761_9BACT|nr:hypothetical protein [Hymenobacter psychrotolerans]SHL26283.1 hypothetical protein SAMN02746009_02443 [Hymenobacter psychrotolerans DSM 18569]
MDTDKYVEAVYRFLTSPWYWLFLFIVWAGLITSSLTSCTASRPRPEDIPALVTALHRDSLASRPDSLPKQNFFQRISAGVFGGAGKTKSVVKYKGPTTIIYGNGNTASAATKPGSVATGTGAVATDARKASAPVVVGEGNQAASSRKGPAVAGDGNTVTAPAPSAWWKWLLGGTVLGFGLRQFGPGLLRWAIGVTV